MPDRPNKVDPIERFPVNPRADGRFQKRINGQLFYFGRDGDRAAALKEYRAVADDLYAGRMPRPAAEAVDGQSVREIANLYLDDLKGGVTGGVSAGHVKATIHVLRKFVRYCGASRAWSDLRPDDFTAFGKVLRKTMGGYAFNRARAGVVAMFNHAAEQDWIPNAPKFGRGFARVPAGDLRSGRVDRLLTSADLNALLGVAGWQLFAMILLGVNGGFGGGDCAALERKHVDLDVGLIRLRRPKTKIRRITPLWPETVWAIRRLLLSRPADSFVFRTKSGNPWSGTAVAHEFGKVVTRAGLELPDNVGLYACRHTFATYANEMRDTDARLVLMGRRLPGLDDVYVETLFVERLKSVTDHVRTRLQIAQVIGDLTSL